MVRRAALLLLVLSLAGCGFFTASLFPGYLAQVEKSHELGSSIDGFLGSLGGTGYRWYPKLFVLTTDAGIDYGGVLIEIDSLPDKLLLLADSAGNLQQLKDPRLGQLHLKDAISQFVVGQAHFAPGSLPSAVFNEAVNGNYLGFAPSVSENYLVFTSGTTTITYQKFTSGWGAGTANAVTVDAVGSYELRGLYYDPGAIAGQEVVLVFFDFSSNRVLVFFTPVSSYISGPLSPLTMYPSLQFYDADAGNVFYTRKGIVVADYDGNAALMDFSGKETGKKLDLGQGGEVRIAFDIEGDTFYVFNPENRVLYRGITGW